MMKKVLYSKKTAAAIVLLLLPAAAYFAGRPVLARYETAHRETLELVRTAEYVIRFDGNFGDDPSSSSGYGSMADFTVVRGTVYVLPENEFVKTGDGGSSYVFSGWNTAADGSGTAYTDQAEVADAAGAWETVTLYAQWAVTRGPVLTMAGSAEVNETEEEPERTDDKREALGEEAPENGNPGEEVVRTDPKRETSGEEASEEGALGGDHPESGDSGSADPESGDPESGDPEEEDPGDVTQEGDDPESGNPGGYSPETCVETEAPEEAGPSEGPQEEGPQEP